MRHGAAVGGEDASELPSTASHILSCNAMHGALPTLLAQHCWRPSYSPDHLPQAVMVFAATVSYLSYVLLVVLFAFKLAKVGLCTSQSGSENAHLYMHLKFLRGPLSTHCACLSWKQ